MLGGDRGRGMYRKVMSTHMHTGGGGKQKRMWAEHKKNKAQGESHWTGLPGSTDKWSNPVQSLEPTEQMFATLSGPMDA